MKVRGNKLLVLAIIIGLVFHGTCMFFTLEKTYDALIHLFFAEHYTNNWFEPWNYKWYTGFTTLSYPPLVHQSIAALSLLGGLKFGLFVLTLIIIILFITGVFRFSLLITSHKNAAGYSAILAIFSSSFLETLHLFGQLPSILGIAILLHALPEIYLWLKSGKYKYLATSLSLIAVTVTSHHVTSIFGMIFFIVPLIGTVILDICYDETKSYKNIKIGLFFKVFLNQLKRNLTFGISALILIIVCILPYWINSKNNPITQVPIPHGSRDNFFEVASSGLIFFLIPWGILLLFLPYFFYRYFSKRFIFFGISFTMLMILGTGSTTPITKLILGKNAFEILTLDRFTFWASIMALPLLGELAYHFIKGDLKTFIVNKFGKVYHRLIGSVIIIIFLFTSIFTVSLGYFRPLQPEKIKTLPIVNFLNQDQHYKWRFLTLGFGDQMAWLSSQTQALTVDGNYHSARRLPELTTRPVERLESAKYQGVAGIGSLQQFLTVPEKYNLKFIFSNDKFYDPILYFCGWHRVKSLEDGIMIWEKINVPPLSDILPKEEIDLWQKISWGIIPFLTMLIAFLVNIKPLFYRFLKSKKTSLPQYLKYNDYKNKFSSISYILHIWGLILLIFISFGFYNFIIKNDSQISPKNVIIAYYDALDYKNFEKSFSLIDPYQNIKLSQFMLEVLVTDGLISSYSKLDSIDIKTIQKTKKIANLKVTTKWITPLKKVVKTDYVTTVNRNGKWFIKKDELDTDLAPDQFYSLSENNYFNQGRRRVTTEQTYHEDVLKQPILEILNAKLVKLNSSYSIIGEIQNIDNVPADIVIKGTLYNDKNKELASYNAKTAIKHKLMPKEISSFRINFEGIAWSKTKESIPNTFNPDEFTPIALNEQPTKFNLQAEGNVTNSDLFKRITISDLNKQKSTIKGTLFNSGVQEITIPQLLVTYYNDKKEILWVETLILNDGIKQQRKLYFTYPILKNKEIKIINTDMSNCYVNGLPNNSISDKILTNRIKNHYHNELQSIDNDKLFKFIKIELNSYIGNPN